MGLSFRPFDLRIDCGRWKDLDFTDNPRPTFSWAVQGTGSGQYQTACRLTVADAHAELWDSGWVRTQKQCLTYDGVALKGSHIYTVSLQVQNQSGERSECVRRRFATALLEAWPASWLEPADDYGDGAIYTIRRFELSEMPENCFFYACGLGYHSLYLNGNRIALDDWMTPPFTSYHKRCCYTAHTDLQKLLHIGKNVIGMVIAPGWRRNEGEYLKATGGREIPFMGRPCFTAVLELFGKNGKHARICADEKWESTRGAIVQTNIFQGETYDARNEIPHWCTPEMAYGTGCRLAEPPAKAYAMELQKLEPVQIGKRYRPQAITMPEQGRYIFDFGQNLAGVCELRIPADLPEGSRITIRHGELLDENGMLYTAPLRSAAATDCYISGGVNKNGQLWTPSFTYHGFRYAEVTGLNAVPDSESITALALYNAVDNSSTFRCGNSMVNALHESIVATERANLHNLPTDCPQRDERMFWLNDATVRFEELPFNFETGRLFPKIVHDIMDAQDEVGAIPCTVPFIYGTQPTDPVCSSFLIAAKQAYLHHGDTTLLREAYPALCAWNDRIYQMSNDGIVSNTLYGDWASPEDCCMEIAPFSAVTHGAVLSTGYCYYNARLLERFAEILSLEQDAAAHRDRAEMIRRAMLQEWLQEDGTFASGSQACQAFALWLDIIPSDKRKLVAEKLHKAVENAGFRLTTGNLCTLYVMDALAENGCIEDAWKLLTREEYPSWGYMLQNDATTIWERFELKKDPTMNSHCHPMFGAVDAWLYAYLAGIRPTDAGFSKVMIQPVIPKQLTFAEAVLDTCKGCFYVKWKKQYGKLALFVEIPFGAQAEIRLCGEIHHASSGSYHFLFDQPERMYM